MSAKKANKEIDITTEARIKAAARSVFHKKGFAATRTRDIAEEAQINLALLNYYFRSKEKLFDLIMLETMQGFFQSMSLVFNEDKTSLEEKIETVAERYIDLLNEQPDIPIFLLNELRNNPGNLPEKFNMKQILMDSYFFKQWEEAIEKSKTKLNPLHFIINLMSLVMFPFVGSPIVKMLGNLNNDDYKKLMIERKALIPQWVKAMLNPK